MLSDFSVAARRKRKSAWAQRRDILRLYLAQRGYLIVFSTYRCHGDNLVNPEQRIRAVEIEKAAQSMKLSFIIRRASCIELNRIEKIDREIVVC